MMNPSTTNDFASATARLRAADQARAEAKAARARRAAEVAAMPCPFKVGDGVSYGFNGDSYPATVVEVSPSGHRIVVQDDDARCIKGDSSYGANDAQFLFAVNTKGRKTVFTRRWNGAYVMAGSKGGFWCWSVWMGRSHTRNPSF